MGKIQENNFFDVSHKIVEWLDPKGIWHFPLYRFSGSSLKLYCALCHFANRFGKGIFYMNDERLGTVTCLSARQICRARARLRELGLIKTRKRVGMATDYEIVNMPEMT